MDDPLDLFEILADQPLLVLGRQGLADELLGGARRKDGRLPAQLLAGLLDFLFAGELRLGADPGDLDGGGFLQAPRLRSRLDVHLRVHPGDLVGQFRGAGLDGGQLLHRLRACLRGIVDRLAQQIASLLEKGGERLAQEIDEHPGEDEKVDRLLDDLSPGDVNAGHATGLLGAQERGGRTFLGRDPALPFLYVQVRLLDHGFDRSAAGTGRLFHHPTLPGERLGRALANRLVVSTGLFVGFGQELAGFLDRLYREVLPLLERAKDRLDEEGGKEESKDDHQAQLEQGELGDLQRLENLAHKFHETGTPPGANWSTEGQLQEKRKIGTTPAAELSRASWWSAGYEYEKGAGEHPDALPGTLMPGKLLLV